jgi:hypothetical protein
MELNLRRRRKCFEFAGSTKSDRCCRVLSAIERICQLLKALVYVYGDNSLASMFACEYDGKMIILLGTN